MIVKYFFLFILTSVAFGVAFAWQNNSLDPKAIESMVTECKKISQNNDSCTKIRAKAARLNRFAYELRVNPLQYGSKVLALQENLIDPRSKRQLKERLSVIKWLEAPER